MSPKDVIEAKKSIALSRLYLLRGLRKGAKQFPQFGEVAKAIAQDDVSYAGFSLEDATKVAYCPKPMDKFDVHHRMRTKLGRYIRRRFPTLEVSDAVLNNFTNLVVSCNPKADENIKVISGNAIVKAYQNEVGGHSCMTGYNNDETPVIIYEENDCVRMLIYEDSETVARALLWTTDDGTTVLDRIYPNYGAHVETMQRYAAQQGWVYRLDASAPSNSGVDLSDNRKYSVTVTSKSERWPYMDTFRFAVAVGNQSKATLYNYPPRAEYVILDSTDGDWGADLISCAECGERFSSDRLNYINDLYICSDCVENYYWWSAHEHMHFHNTEERVYFQDSEYPASLSWADDNAYMCDRCGNRYVYTHMNTVNGEYSEVCGQCLCKYSKCTSCKEFYEKGDLRNDLCPVCYEEEYDDCSECGESIPRDELVKGLCTQCREEAVSG